MAPELVAARQYSGVAVDMWAAGVLLYLLVTARFPFLRQDEEHLDQVGPLSLPWQRINLQYTTSCLRCGSVPFVPPMKRFDCDLLHALSSTKEAEFW